MPAKFGSRSTFSPTGTQEVDLLSINGTTQTAGDFLKYLNQLNGVLDMIAAGLKTLPAARGRTTIIAQKGASNGAQTIYTVTAGKTFYLVHANIMSNGTLANCFLIMNGVSVVIHTLFASTTVITTPINPSVPMPFTAGTTFLVQTSAATGTSQASIMGWEE